MGSYCVIKFDALEVCIAKSVVPDDFCALFQEGDRQVRSELSSDEKEEADDTPQIVYETSREALLSRLALLGCTSAVVRDCFEAWRRDQLERWKGYTDDGWGGDVALALESLSFEVWAARAREVLAGQFDDKESKDEIDRRMRDIGSDDSWLWFAGYGTPLSIRALLDACLDTKKISLDISDLIGGGGIEENVALCADRRAADPIEYRPMAPVVVLAEGSSDIRILRKALVTLFPERQDYFSFFDHIELNVDGGANYLVKFLKAIAAARASIRLIAVFDNDVIGKQAFEQARRLQLPPNFILLRLPDIEIARAYPTIGPQGNHAMNINGRACSIELYLGNKALMKNGELRPVRWAGYVSIADAYQGEVEGKSEVEGEFFASADTHGFGEPARLAYPELAQIWEAIFAAVEASSESMSREHFVRVLQSPE